MKTDRNCRRWFGHNLRSRTAIALLVALLGSTFQFEAWCRHARCQWRHFPFEIGRMAFAHAFHMASSPHHFPFGLGLHPCNFPFTPCFGALLTGDFAPGPCLAPVRLPLAPVPFVLITVGDHFVLVFALCLLFPSARFEDRRTDHGIRKKIPILTNRGPPEGTAKVFC